MNLAKSFFLIIVLCAIQLEGSSLREGRITGGREAEPNSRPFIVSLQTRSFWWRYRLCSGSILSERWILSAGHCVTDRWARWLPMDAIIGAHNLAYIRSSQIYPISHRIAHPYYRGGVGPYDIAMMRTARDIEFSENVQPIGLPLLPPRDESARDSEYLITGWGALQSNFFYSVLPNKLQEARVTYLPYYDCYRAVDKLKEYYEPNPLRRIHNLCTGPISGGIAGCTGDSGGPLVVYVPNMPAVTEPSPSTEMSSTSSSPIPMTTDRTSTTSTTTERATTSETTMSSITMSTESMTSSTASPTPMSTDRTSTMSSTMMEVSSTTMEMNMTMDGVRGSGGWRVETSVTGNERNPRQVEMMPTVIGVISWGVVPCGKRGAPTVYSNVSNYMDFINKYLLSDYY